MNVPPTITLNFQAPLFKAVKVGRQVFALTQTHPHNVILAVCKNLLRADYGNTIFTPTSGMQFTLQKHDML